MLFANRNNDLSSYLVTVSSNVNNRLRITANLGAVIRRNRQQNIMHWKRPSWNRS